MSQTAEGKTIFDGVTPMYDMPPGRESGAFGSIAELEARRRQEAALREADEKGHDRGMQDGRDQEKVRLQRIMAGEMSPEEAFAQVELLDKMHAENVERRKNGQDPITLEQIAEYAGSASMRRYAELEDVAQPPGKFYG